MHEYEKRLPRGMRAYMRDILRNYPDICQKPQEQRTRNEQRRVDIVDAVLDAVDHMQDAQDKRKIIEMVYFKQSHTITGAAVNIPIGCRTASKWNAQIMELMQEIMHLP